MNAVSDPSRLPQRAEPTYEVGYGRPPVRTRFKPGQSGNPKGRPKGAKNRPCLPGEELLKHILLEEAYRDVTVRDGNRNVTVPMEIPSKTMTDEQFHHDEAEDGTPVVLSGDLKLPNWNEKLPVVILLYDSDRPKSLSVVMWRSILEKQGLAPSASTLFTGRNITNTETDQSKFGLLNAIHDVYRTVADPRIDGNRDRCDGLLSRRPNGAICCGGALPRIPRPEERQDCSLCSLLRRMQFGDRR